MASRFLFQKFSDGMSRSTSRFGTHVSARAATVHETLGNVFHGSAAHLPGMKGLSNRGIHGYVSKYLKQTSSASKQAQDVAREPELSLHEIGQKDVDTTIALLAFTSISFLYLCYKEGDFAGRNKGTRCNCQCNCSNVKKD